MQAEHVLDCKGLACPMPIVRLSKAFKELASGAHLRVLADDPAFEPDVQAWCNKTGNKLVSLQTGGAGITAVIEKA